MYFPGLCLQCETQCHMSQPHLPNLLNKDNLTFPFLNQTDPSNYFLMSCFLCQSQIPKLPETQTEYFPLAPVSGPFYTLKYTKWSQIWKYHKDPDLGVSWGHLCRKLCPRHLQKGQDSSGGWGGERRIFLQNRKWVKGKACGRLSMKLGEHMEWTSEAVTTSVSISWDL